jgi:hypothetical protein
MWLFVVVQSDEIVVTSETGGVYVITPADRENRSGARGLEACSCESRSSLELRRDSLSF